MFSIEVIYIHNFSFFLINTFCYLIRLISFVPNSVYTNLILDEICKDLSHEFFLGQVYQPKDKYTLHAFEIYLLHLFLCISLKIRCW